MGTLNRDIRRRLMVSGVGALLLATTAIVSPVGTAPARAAGVPYAVGDVFAGTGNGQIKHFSPTGTLLDTLNTTSASLEEIGMCFEASGNLISANFQAGTTSKFDNAGNLLAANWAGPYSTHPEDCVRDGVGNIYVGEVDGANQLQKFSSAGTLLATYSPATERRGIDWFDLAADQCTMLYTSEGPSVKSFNVCANTQNADFATGLAAPCFALRIRANGEVMVTCSTQTYRLSSAGAVLQTYPIAGEFLFAMNLDPDGTRYWTAGYFSGNIFKVDIATGAGTSAPVFNAVPYRYLSGLAIFGEPTAAVTTISLAPLTATNPVGTNHAVTATVTENSTPVVGKTVTFTVIAGPNTGVTGTGTTDGSGQATFTYTGAGGVGTDVIHATYVDSSGRTETSNKVEKTWTVATDPAITASGVAVAATEGTAFSGTVATFTDPDTAAFASEYTATIHWGDGTSSAGTISGSGGSFTVSGGHTYAEEGTHTVTVTITDTDNAANKATVTSTATVADATLTSACAMPSLTTQAFSGKTATFTDASSTGTLSDFTASINWGDSSTSAGTIAGGPGTTPYAVSGSHTYGSTGYFTVTTTITDVGGSTTTATCTKVLVFAFAPGGGAFAIGDKESKIGASVTFWGAQWSKNNPVSSGTTVAAFKGFAEKPTTPTCGTTWSTDPGNSTPPPAGPLPAYMGVIVTSRYSQSGSLISGDTVHIVIVNTTNSGYDPGIYPNPGHPGTGKVVASGC